MIFAVTVFVLFGSWAMLSFWNTDENDDQSPSSDSTNDSICTLSRTSSIGSTVVYESRSRSSSVDTAPLRE